MVDTMDCKVDGSAGAGGNGDQCGRDWETSSGRCPKSSSNPLDVGV